MIFQKLIISHVRNNLQNKSQARWHFCFQQQPGLYLFPTTTWNTSKIYSFPQKGKIIAFIKIVFKDMKKIPALLTRVFPIGAKSGFDTGFQAIGQRYEPTKFTN